MQQHHTTSHKKRYLMKKIMLALLCSTSLVFASHNRITNYSSQSKINVILATIASGSFSGLFTHLATYPTDDFTSKSIVTLATLAGGTAGWWWSSSITPEERFNAAVKLLEQPNTRYITMLFERATTIESILAHTDSDYKNNEHPRVTLVLNAESLLHELKSTMQNLEMAISTEISRPIPNQFLIDQGSIYINQYMHYIAVLEKWIPELKKDPTFLLQYAVFTAQQAKEAARQAEVEARFARMDIEFARWEARAHNHN